LIARVRLALTPPFATGSSCSFPSVYELTQVRAFILRPQVGSSASRFSEDAAPHLYLIRMARPRCIFHHGWPVLRERISCFRPSLFVGFSPFHPSPRVQRRQAHRTLVPHSTRFFRGDWRPGKEMLSSPIEKTVATALESVCPPCCPPRRVK